MEWLLVYSTNITVVIWMFFGALAGLHILFIWLFPLSASHWKLAEYVWVLLAMASIIGVLEEARSLKADANVAAAESKAENTIAALENWFDVYGRYACEDGPKADLSQPFCRWAKVKNSELELVLANEEFPADVPINLLSGLEKLKDAIADVDKQMVRGHLDNYLLARKAYLKAAENTRHTSYFSLFTSLAPLLFALAVALKFTKVTGEYLIIRRGK